MNLPPANTPRSASTEAPPREAVRNVDPRHAQQQRDAFERSLRNKSSQLQESGAEKNAPDGASAGLFAGALLGLQAKPPAPAQPAAGTIEVKTGARAAIEAALTHLAPEATPLGVTDPAGVWEASVREVNSVPVDVRLSRAEKTPNEIQPSWNVVVGSSAVNAEVLARHAPRLNERLRKHGVNFDHVRIQRDEGDA